ncbi:MAG: anti-sigma factor family protein [Elusimicrobiota bacterium]
MKKYSKEELNKYIDQEFSKEKMGRIEDHLKNCKECREFVRDIKKIQLEFQETAKTGPPDKVWENIERKIREEKNILKPEKSFFMKLKPIWPALAVAAAIIVGMIIINDKKNSSNEINEYISRQLSYYDEKSLVVSWEDEVEYEDKTVVDYFLEGNSDRQLSYEEVN